MTHVGDLEHDLEQLLTQVGDAHKACVALKLKLDAIKQNMERHLQAAEAALSEAWSAIDEANLDEDAEFMAVLEESTTDEMMQLVNRMREMLS